MPVVVAPSPAVVTPAVVTADPDIPAEWLTCTPIQAAERMIAERPGLLEHRRGGKRAKDAVGEQTPRQIMWAATLLEKSLPPGTPLWKVTKQDILALNKYFEQLPVQYGKAQRDRDPAQTLKSAAAEANKKMHAKQLAADKVGLSTGTSNKHFNRLAQIHKYMRKHVEGAPVIDFSEFTAAVEGDAREARLRYTREQGEAIFRLPSWTGCKSVNDRLTAGSHVFHDSLFYVLLLVWYTAARREELCKLLLDDVEERHGIAYLLMRPTEIGRVKNAASRRTVVLADELIRLGFLRYVDAMRAAGERLLFPELMPGRADTKRKLGDVFYKIWWMYISPLVPDLKPGQAMHSARHMASDELKDKEIFI